MTNSLLNNQTLSINDFNFINLDISRNDLINTQKKLIENIKNKYPFAYNFLLQKDIELTDITKYASAIAASLIIFTNTVDTQKQTESITSLTPMVSIIDVDELRGLNEEQKANLVWERYGHIIQRVADKYDVDPKLIFATIMVESGGNTYAKRSEPAIRDASYGLGQILYGTAVGLGFRGTPDDLYDPEINIEYIGIYHQRNKKVYGDLTNEQLTIAYNAGNPYGYPTPGHLTKFDKWFNIVSKLVS